MWAAREWVDEGGLLAHPQALLAVLLMSQSDTPIYLLEMEHGFPNLREYESVEWAKNAGEWLLDEDYPPAAPTAILVGDRVEAFFRYTIGRGDHGWQTPTETETAEATELARDARRKGRVVEQ